MGGGIQKRVCGYPEEPGDIGFSTLGRDQEVLGSPTASLGRKESVPGSEGTPSQLLFSLIAFWDFAFSFKEVQISPQPRPFAVTQVWKLKIFSIIPKKKNSSQKSAREHSGNFPSSPQKTQMPDFWMPGMWLSAALISSGPQSRIM